MKNSLLFFLLLLLGTNSFAQEKADVLSCLKVIFAHPTMEDAFQNETSQGKTVFIRGSLTPVDLQQRGSKLQSIQNTIVQDDFYDFPQAIQVVANEYEREGEEIDIDCLLNYEISGDENELRFLLRTYVVAQKADYTWFFRFEYQNNEWTNVYSNLIKEPIDRKRLDKW